MTSIALGKRKSREEDVAPHGSTLFVSNLPYTATSTDLQTLFSDIAPVRSAFVVLQQGSGVSKGVGYVSFAIKEDAQSAFDKLTKEGLTLDGRKLRVEWAEHKTKAVDDTDQEERKPRPPPPSRPSTARDPNSIRTVVISGLPSSIDSKTLWKKIRKHGGAESVEWPLKLPNGDEDSGVAHALFSTPATAQDAVSKLHAHVFKSALLSVTLKKRLDSLAKVPAETTLSSVKSGAPSRASRLIVRNLPWNITEQDLRAKFLPHGPIHSIHIPSVSQESGKPRAKGFAFVWMLSKKDAEVAIEKCNGTTVRAGIAEGIVSSKQKKKKQLREEKKSKAFAKEEVGGEKAEDEDEAEADGPAETDRVMAVDWALSKEKWQEEKAKLKEGNEGEDVKMGDVESEGDDDASDSDSSDEDEEQLGVHRDDMTVDDGNSDDNRGDEEMPTKPQLPPPETGTTLFIRNVPFTATDDELRTLFRAFGPLRYARTTMDAATGRSRGTGFVCFWKKEDADKVVEQSDLLRSEMTGSQEVPKKNPFTLPSILTPDPSSILAQSLVLQGRTLDVVRAVTRDEATQLKDEGEKKREKADKRNMYLLREGVILPNTPAAATLDAAEVERRTNSFNARRALLKSNPSLYISKTRLSIRQIPIFVTERILKRLALHAVRTFEAEAKSRSREGLTPDELADPVVDEDGAEGEGENAKKKGKSTERHTGVKQSKIVRQQERVDPVTGKGRSKGYGFLEMTTHANALRVLRWANNNPGLGSLFDTWWRDELGDLIKVEKQKAEKDKDAARLKRLQDELAREDPKKSKGTLIVEFSIENVQVVQRRSAQQKDRSTGPDKRKARRESVSAVKGEEAPPKKKKRRLSTVETKPDVKSESDNVGSKIGSLIGRKRKERKGKKAGR